MFAHELKTEAFAIIRKYRFSERWSVPFTSCNRGSTLLIVYETINISHYSRCVTKHVK